MDHNFPLAEEKKLTVIFRVESGCLGPQGATEVLRFCPFAQQGMGPVEPDCINWKVIPRTNKTDPEIEFTIGGKLLTDSMAERYLSMFGICKDSLEMNMLDEITNLIDLFMGRPVRLN